MPNTTDPPECLLLVICSDVIEDKQTNNKTLINLFNTVGGPVLPIVQPMVTFVASVWNVKGTVPFRFELTSPSGETIFKMSGEAKCPDPLQVSDIVVKVLGLPLKEWGRHSLLFWMADHYISSRFLDIAQINMPGAQ